MVRCLHWVPVGMVSLLRNGSLISMGLETYSSERKLSDLFSSALIICQCLFLTVRIEINLFWFRNVGRAEAMAQYFHGQLSGLMIEQMEEAENLVSCVRDCQEYLDMPDVQSQSDMVCHSISSETNHDIFFFQTFSSDSNRSIWKIQTDSSESFEQLLKHIVYRNTLEPIGPSGQRTVSIETTLKCVGENFVYPLPLFTRRLSIDEIIRPTNIELKSESKIFTTDGSINRGIYLFRNLSIYTDNVKKDQADISDCSINTTPDLSDQEQFIVPDEYLQMNNLEKIPTRTGLVLSGRIQLNGLNIR